MNKRIFELIQEQNGNRGLLLSEEDKEEFAELIIEECIQKITLAEKSKDNVVLWQDKDRNHITWLLRQHFGVEE